MSVRGGITFRRANITLIVEFFLSLRSWVEASTAGSGGLLDPPSGRLSGNVNPLVMIKVYERQKHRQGRDGVAGSEERKRLRGSQASNYTASR